MRLSRTSSILQLLRVYGKESSRPVFGGHHYSSVAANVESSEVLGRWQIVGAACITRPPIICPPMTPIENELSELLAKMEKEHSLKNDHELRREQDTIRAELLKMNEADDIDLEETQAQTALEYEDACVEELKALTFASKVTEADETGALDTFDRALSRSLILVVQQKLGKDYKWMLPQSPWIPGETLRQTCERVVREKCGSDLSVKFLGNAPCGFYKYKYPKHLFHNEGYIGAKVFFYKCQVKRSSGEVRAGEDIGEHHWLSLDELDGKLKNSYAKSVSRFLVSDK